MSDIKNIQLDLNYYIPEMEYFVERKCKPNWCILKEPIKFHDLSFIYSGKCIYTINGIEYLLQEGDLLYVPPGSVRSAITDKTQLMHMYAINFNWLYPANDKRALPFPVVMHLESSTQLMILYKQINHLWLEKKENYIMESRALFSIILSMYLSAYKNGTVPTPIDNRIVRIKDYVLNNFDQSLTIDKISRHVQLSPNYLGSLFKESEGISLKSYINKIRINHAENLLLNENMSVSEVAEKCGFSDVFYFSKVYKKLRGVAPTHMTSYASYR